MRRALAVLACLVCLTLTGCAARHAWHVEYYVGEECHPKLELIGCDQASPPEHCKKILATFDRNCERIVLK